MNTGCGPHYLLYQEINHQLLIQIGTGRLHSKRVKLWIMGSVDLHHPWREVQGGNQGMKHPVLWEKALQTDNFRFYEPSSCIFHIYKSTKIFRVSIYSLWLAAAFWKKKQKKVCLIASTLPSPKSYMPYLFGTVSQSNFKYCLLGYSPRFTPQ